MATSNEPEVYFDIVATGENSNMSIEQATRLFLAYKVCNENEIEELYESRIILKEEKYEEEGECEEY